MSASTSFTPVLAQGQGVGLALVPSSRTIELDGTGVLTVDVRPNGKPLAGIQRFITFDPEILQVKDADSNTPGVQVSSVPSPLGIVLENTVDNAEALIRYDAGTFTNSSTATFNAARKS